MLRVSLGQLVVEITTDLTNLNTGLKNADKAVKDTSGKISEYTNKIALATTAIGAAITGAFAMMIKSTTDYGEEIYRTSERSGVAVETLSKLKYVAEQTETSFEQVAMGLRFLNRNIFEATNGNLKANETFRMLGITLKDDLTGNVMKADEVLLKMAEKFSTMEDSASKTGLAVAIFGRSGEGMIPILNLGSEGIARLSQEAERLGIVLTAENAKAIDKFSDGMKSMRAAVGGLWLEITTLLLPSLDDLVKKVTDVIVKAREWSEVHPQLSKRLAELTLGLGALMLIIGPLLLIFNQLIQALFFLNTLLPGSIALLGRYGAIGLAAFAGWNIGRLISEISGLDNALSGPNGLFTKMYEWLDKNEKKIQNIARIATIIATLGISEFFKKPATAKAEKTPGPEIDLGKISVNKPATELDQTTTLLERHAQKLKELNELYLTGKINAQQYYEEIKKLHEDGLDIKQRELDLLNQSIDLERSASDVEYQRLYVMGEGIKTAQEYARIKAEMANQDLVDQQNSLNAATNLLQTLQSMHITMWQGIFDFVNMGIQKFSTGFSTALTSIILGTKKAGEAFKDFGKMMLEAIVEFLVQWAVQAAISMALGAVLAAWVTGIATEIAAAWLPAAVFASIATMGGADVAGAVGLAGALGAGIGMFAGMTAIRTAAAAPALTTLGEGGIVTEPTLALIGEKGPEMVTPLDRGAEGIKINIENITVAQEGMSVAEIAEKLGEDIKTKLKRP